jgi:threonine/homoserine/homoserine lactone efflux protein
MIGMIVGIAVMLLALALVVIASIAYRKSHLRATLYLGLAFLLFAVKKALELSQRMKGTEGKLDAVIDTLEALFLILFFVAIWRR